MSSRKDPFPLRLVLLGIAILFLSVISPAQDSSKRLRGVVQDSRGSFVKDAKVTISEGGAVSVTNAKGEFSIVVASAAPVLVEISAPGYYPLSQVVDPSHETELKVTLSRTVLATEEISVETPRLMVPLSETAAATSVIGGEILSTMPRNVGAEEPLASVAGVKVDNQANQERVHVSIRGQGILTERGIRGIEVLLDGLPLNDPTGFAPDLFDVDWASVSEIDVVRGPAAFLYGGGSSGGVIDISTRSASETPYGEFVGAGGSNGFYKSHLDYSQKIGNAGLFLSASRTAGDGYRVHTNFYGDNLYGKLSFKVGSSLQLNFIGSGTGYFNQNPEGLNIDQVREDPRQPNPDALTYNEYQKTKRGLGGLTGQWRVAENQSVSFSTYWRYTQYAESVPSSVDHQKVNSPGGSAQYDIAANIASLKHHISFGVDLDGQMTDDLRHPNLGGGLENSDVLANQHILEKRTAGFVSDRIELGSRWSALASVRWDRISNEVTDYLKSQGLDLSGQRTFERATGRLGVTFNPKKDFGFYASWGQGFLPPATEELYANPDALGGFNRHLVPASSWGVEGGARGNIRDRLFFNTAVFHLDTANDFERYRISGRPLETFYGNAGKTNRYGVETELRYYASRRVSFSGAYTYSHFVYSEYNSNVYQGELVGNRLPNAPNHQLYMDTSLALPYEISAGVSTQIFSRAYIDPTNQASIGGYGLLNARLSKQWHCGKLNCNVFVSGRNLLARDYIAFTEPDPDGNSYQPGPRREVFGGLKVSF